MRLRTERQSRAFWSAGPVNKVKGIRAAVVGDSFSAKATSEHNDANILCMGARVIDIPKAIEFLDIFLDTPFSEGENHIRRISKLEE